MENEKGKKLLKRVSDGIGKEIKVIEYRHMVLLHEYGLPPLCVIYVLMAHLTTPSVGQILMNDELENMRKEAALACL
jgi:hypothetical protein